jgi:hypothetical protein
LHVRVKITFFSLVSVLLLMPPELFSEVVTSVLHSYKHSNGRDVSPQQSYTKVGAMCTCTPQPLPQSHAEGHVKPFKRRSLSLSQSYTRNDLTPGMI